MKYKYFWSSQNKTSPLLKTEDGELVGSIPNGVKLADYAFIQATLRTMLGQVLTVIDASILDKIQNKAIKDIIRGQFIDQYLFLSDQMNDKEEIEAMVKDFEENLTDEDMSKLEAVTNEEVAGA